MKRALRDLWALTLESGNYKQTKQYLRNGNNKCCCLGVLCDILDPKGWKPSNGSNGGHFEYRPSENRHGWNSPGSMPSTNLFKKAGLSVDEGLRLAKLNDNGMSFYAIAHEVRQLPVED